MRVYKIKDIVRLAPRTDELQVLDDDLIYDIERFNHKYNCNVFSFIWEIRNITPLRLKSITYPMKIKLLKRYPLFTFTIDLIGENDKLPNPFAQSYLFYYPELMPINPNPTIQDMLNQYASKN